MSQYKCPTYLLSNVKKENVDIQCQSQQQGCVLGARCIFSEKLHFHNVRVCVLLLVVVTWSVFISEKLHVEHDNNSVQPADRGGVGRTF